MGSTLRRARRALNRVMPRRYRDALLFVDDNAGWIVDEIARQLKARLPPPIKCDITADGWSAARGCRLHFLNRVWAWNDRVLEQIDASNQLIGVWWHGRFDSPDAATQAALARLQTHHHRFARFQVTCSSARETLDAAGVPSDRVVTLPIGVELTRFRPPSSDEGAAARRALGIADGVF